MIDNDLKRQWLIAKSKAHSVSFLRTFEKLEMRKVTNDEIHFYSLNCKLITDQISRKSITGTTRRSIVFGHTAEGRQGWRSRFVKQDANSYFKYPDEIPLIIEIHLFHAKLNDKFKIIEFFTRGLKQSVIRTCRKISLLIFSKSVSARTQKITRKIRRNKYCVRNLAIT